ncbi:MAG: hypothetical protein M3309_08315 [Actinomycetota bacterium]|nr:hypothetical protein [Actinomycetota bacterium]
MRGQKMTLRVYAQLAAVVLVTLGLAVLAGVIEMAWPADSSTWSWRCLFAHLGFFQRATMVVRG